MSPDHKTILARILNHFAPVGAETVDQFSEFFQEDELMKNEILFHEKRLNDFEYFQLTGISHRFNANEKKEAITTGIYQHETVITPHIARTYNGQSIFSVQALTACTYLKIPAAKFRELFDQSSQIRQFGRMAVEREFARQLKFEVLFRSSSARDRLLFFRENFPGLENLIPHTIIASFLGITPVSFSRLRNEMARK